MKLYDAIKDIDVETTDFFKVGDLTDEDFRELGWEAPTTPILKQLSDTLKQWMKVEGLFYRDVRCHYGVEGKTDLWFLVEMSKRIEVYTSMDDYLKEKLKAGFDDVCRQHFGDFSFWKEGENESYKTNLAMADAVRTILDATYSHEEPKAWKYGAGGYADTQIDETNKVLETLKKKLISAYGSLDNAYADMSRLSDIARRARQIDLELFRQQMEGYASAPSPFDGITDPEERRKRNIYDDDDF